MTHNWRLANSGLRHFHSPLFWQRLFAASNLGFVVADAVRSIADRDIRARTVKNIVCVGGGACLPGFDARFREVRNLG